MLRKKKRVSSASQERHTNTNPVLGQDVWEKFGLWANCHSWPTWPQTQEDSSFYTVQELVESGHFPIPFVGDGFPGPELGLGLSPKHSSVLQRSLTTHGSRGNSAQIIFSIGEIAGKPSFIPGVTSTFKVPLLQIKFGILGAEAPENCIHPGCPVVVKSIHTAGCIKQDGQLHTC